MAVDSQITDDKYSSVYVYHYADQVHAYIYIVYNNSHMHHGSSPCAGRSQFDTVPEGKKIVSAINRDIQAPQKYEL